MRKGKLIDYIQYHYRNSEIRTEDLFHMNTILGLDYSPNYLNKYLREYCNKNGKYSNIVKYDGNNYNVS